MSLTWTVTDAYSPIGTESGCDPVSVAVDQQATSYTCRATSETGATTETTVSIARDATAPTLNPTGLNAGQVVAIGQPVPAVSPGAQDATSGVASASCATVSPASVGARSVTCTAADNAGNAATPVSISYYMTDAFRGFMAPLPRTSQQAGSTLPVTFTLTNWAGTSRVKTGTVKVTTAPPGSPVGTATTSAACAWDAGNADWMCLLRMPAKAGTYQIRVLEKEADGTWQLVANASKPSSRNPTTLTVR